VSTSSFPFSIQVNNIKSSSGTLNIEWVLEDEDGNVSTSLQTSPQNFTQQN
jgi:hypothetical protein